MGQNFSELYSAFAVFSSEQLNQNFFVKNSFFISLNYTELMVGESNFLSDRQVEDLQMVTEIINELAFSDGFPNLDACLKNYPDRLETYNRYAIAALNALRRVQGYSAEIFGNVTDGNIG